MRFGKGSTHARQPQVAVADCIHGRKGAGEARDFEHLGGGVIGVRVVTLAETVYLLGPGRA